MNYFAAFCRGAVALLFAPLCLPAQGLLTPSGAPAPTMFTLEQLGDQLGDLLARAEARKPLSAATTPGDASSTFIITAPGSYYLAGEVAVVSGGAGVTIAASNVTLDLNGFGIVGTGKGTGIVFSGRKQTAIDIGGGAITGCTAGVVADTTELAGVRLHDLRLSGNSGRGIALLVPNSTSVLAERVQVDGGMEYGIHLPESGSAAIGCQVSNLSTTGQLVGIGATVVRDCTVRNLTGVGYLAGIRGVQVESCVVDSVTTEAVGSGGSAWMPIHASQAHNCTVRRLRYSNGIGWGIFSNTGLGNITNCHVGDVELGGTSFTYFAGFGGGVVRGCQLSGVKFTGTNMTAYGIQASLVEQCAVDSVSAEGGYFVGIFAPRVKDCYVASLTGTGGSQDGIKGTTIENNTVAGVRSCGIAVEGGTLAPGGAVSGNTVIGAGEGVGNTGAAGIYVTCADVRIEGNQIVARNATASYGIRVTAHRALVIGNRCSGTFDGIDTGAGGVDTGAFNIGAGNRFGPIITSYAATGEITTTSPWANFADPAR